MRRWIDLWNAYWFPTTSTLPLALSRILAVAAQLLFFFPSLEYNTNLLVKNTAFINPQLLVRIIMAVVPRDVFFTPVTFTALYWITAIAGLLALIGLRTRLALFVFALGSWIFVSHQYSYGDRHHTEALYAMFLMALAFAPSGDSLSVDAWLRRRRTGAASRERSDFAMWPLRFVHVMLALTYLSTGASKLVLGGFRWMNGYTLQVYTFSDALSRDMSLGIWLAQQHNLAIVLSVGTILFETFYFLSIIVPWTAPLFFVGAILFHLGLYYSAAHPFFQNMMLNFILLLVIAPPWWRTWMDKVSGGVSARWLDPMRAGEPA